MERDRPTEEKIIDAGAPPSGGVPRQTILDRLLATLPDHLRNTARYVPDSSLKTEDLGK